MKTNAKALKLPKTAYCNLIKQQQQQSDQKLRRHLMDCQEEWANSPLSGNSQERGIIPNARKATNTMCANQPTYTLSDESLAALKELALVLQTIHQRMLREGYTIVGNRVVKLENDGVETKNKNRRSQRHKERQVP